MSLALILTSCSGGAATSSSAAEASGVEPTIASETTTSTAPATTNTTTSSTSTTTTTTTTIPEALDFDASSDDVADVFLSLDEAYRYLRQHPDAADPDLYFDEFGGARELHFFRSEGLAEEPERPEDVYRIDDVVVQELLDDYAHLYVLTTADQTGRRVLSADGEVRSEDFGRHDPEYATQVELRKEDGRWRVVDRYRAWKPEADFYRAFAPTTPTSFVPRDQTTLLRTDTATWPDGTPLDWEGHAYIDPATGGHCVEIRLPGASRYIQCADAATAVAFKDNVSWAPFLARSGTIRMLTGWGADLPVSIGVRYGPDEATTLRPIRYTSGIGGIVELNTKWIEEITAHFEGRWVGGEVWLGNYVCNDWSRGGDPEFTSMGFNSAEGGRRTETVDELEDVVLRAVYGNYIAPRVEVTSEPPADLAAEVFDRLPAEPTWFVVTVTDWDQDAGDRSQTWAMALAEGTEGWYIADSGFRQDCPSG